METRTGERKKVITWEDPSGALEQLPNYSGLDYMKLMLAGEQPGAPIASHLNMSLDDVAPGTVTFSCSPDESHYNPIGTVHGGFVCSVLDSALGCAAHTTLPAGMGYTSIEIKVNYLRPVLANSGPLRCVGTVTKPGRRVIFAEGEVTDRNGNVVATASGSLLVFPIADAAK